MSARVRRKHRSRDSHPAGRWSWVTEYAGVVVLSALCLWATLPFGSVALWARGVLMVLMTAFFYVVWFVQKHSKCPMPSPKGLVAWLAGGLIVWTWLQTHVVPLGAFSRLASRADGVPTDFSGGGLALDRWVSAHHLYFWIALGLLVWGVSLLFLTKERARMALGGVVVCGTIQAFLGIVLHDSELWAFPLGGGGRMRGTFSGPNTFGGYLAMTIPVTYGLVLDAVPGLVVRVRGKLVEVLATPGPLRLRIIRTAWVALALVAQLVCLLLSASRGANLAAMGVLLVMTVVFLVYQGGSRRERRAVRLVLLVCLGLFALAGVMGYALLARRLEAPSETAYVSRWVIWQSCWQVVRAFPLGVGLGGLRFALPRFQSDGWGAIRMDLAHNDYLQALCESGWLGFVLILGLLLVFFRRTGYVFAAPRVEGGRDLPVWIWRGAMGGVLAALLHAFVDFNLSSRPGVTVTFAALLGVLIAGKGLVESERDSEADGERQKRRVRYRRQIPLLGAVFLSVWFLFIARESVRLLRGDLMRESAATALGWRSDPYFWYFPERVAPERALSFLEAARDQMPGYGWGWYLLGHGRLYDYDRREHLAGLEGSEETEEMRRRRQERELLARSEADIEVRADRLTDYVRAREREEDLSRARLEGLGRAGKLDLLRAERGRIYAQALEELRESARLSPWLPEAQLGLAAVYYRLAGLTDDPGAVSEALAAAERHVEQAFWLAPRDVFTLTYASRHLRRAIGEVDAPEEWGRRAREQLLSWGREVIRLDPSQVRAVAENWVAAGIPLQEILEHPLPLEGLWRLYRAYLGSPEHARYAQPCLLALEIATENPEARTARLIADDDDDEGWTFGRLVLRERLRWLLLMGHWEDYRELHAERAELGAHQAEVSLERVMAHAPRRSNLRYLTLKKLRREASLSDDLRWELGWREWLAGNPRMADRIVAEQALSSPLRDTGAAWWLTPLRGLAGPSLLLDLIKMRIYLERGDFREALWALQDLLEGPDLMSSFRAQARYLEAWCALQLGQRETARVALIELLKKSPHHRDGLELLTREFGGGVPLAVKSDLEVERSVERLSQVVPAYGVQMKFLDGNAVLEGIDIAENPARAGVRQSLDLYWRFHGGVPDDLRVYVDFSDITGRRVASRRLSFTEHAPLVFALGNPQIGAGIRLSIPLDARHHAGRLLRIGLLSRDAWVRSEEGLPYLYLMNWPGWARERIRLIDRPQEPVVMLSGVPDADVSGRLRHEVERRWRQVQEGQPLDPTQAPVVFHLKKITHDPASGLDLGVLGPDGYLIRSLRQRVVLASTTEAGLAYGVGDLYRRTWGTQWFLPDPVFDVPRQERHLSMPAQWVLEAPAFARRFFQRHSGADGEGWAGVNRLSVDGQRSMARCPGPGLNAFFDPASFYDEHPAWYPLVDGVRKYPDNDDWQPCLSAPGLLGRAIAYANDYFDEHPDDNWLSVGMSESPNWCECEECLALLPEEERVRAASERSWSEPYWRFVNALAEHLAPRHAGRMLRAEAFGQVIEPPSFDVSDRVHVLLHQDDAGREQAAGRLSGWAGKATFLGVYARVGRYAPEHAQAGLQRALEAGVREYCVDDGWTDSMDGPLPWMLASWLWNPWQGAGQLQSDFCRSVFGPAASPMSRYFEALAALGGRSPEGEWPPGVEGVVAARASRFDEEARADLLRLLEEARRMAGTDALVLARINRIAERWHPDAD